MNKKIILLLVLVLFITGCSQGFQSNRKGTGTPDGVRMNFLELQPRNELREGESFDIGLKLENKADCNVAGEVCVRDLLTGSISGVEDSCESFTLKKVDDYGYVDSTEVFFTDNVYGSVSGDLKSTIVAEATYSCFIQLTPQLCVKPRREDETICKSRETLTSSTFGLKSAPITVTQIDKLLVPQSNGVKLETSLHLRKMSEGNLEGPLNLNLNYEGYGSLQCRDLDKLEWKKGETEKIIKCEISLNVDDIEDNPLVISLDYYYVNSKTKQITILKEEGGLL